MERTKSLPLVRVVVLLILATLTLAAAAASSSYQILHVFTWAKKPTGNLVRDAAGNLYGTTTNGGSYGCGIAFMLKANSNGTWAYNILYGFKGSPDGCHPEAGLVLDAAGNLYGTTSSGGSTGSSTSAGDGTIFKLKRNANASWTETVLHNFSGTDGALPYAGLIFDTAGNLYGTTYDGGSVGEGAVFELTPNGDGTWSERVLHSFTDEPDGRYPLAGLVFDVAGNLYGTTAAGGTQHSGSVFKLAPNSDGTWTETVVHSFTGIDGTAPRTALVFDTSGNLYGTTSYGTASGCGPSGCGAVFKLAPNLDRTWTDRVLHSFSGPDGASLWSGVIFDTAGSLYGTAMSGGSSDNGVVYKLVPNPDGTWTESVVYSFRGYGSSPTGNLLLDPAGNLYGTTNLGNPNSGLVFKFVPWR